MSTKTSNPSIDNEHTKRYYNKDNKLHREDGPAVEYADGDKVWYYCGKLIHASSNEEFLRMIKMKVFR